MLLLLENLFAPSLAKFDIFLPTKNTRLLNIINFSLTFKILGDIKDISSKSNNVFQTP